MCGHGVVRGRVHAVLTTQLPVTCLLVTVLALLTIPLVLLWRLNLNPQQNAKRLRSKGLTYKAVAAQLHISHSTAGRFSYPLYLLQADDRPQEDRRPRSQLALSQINEAGGDHGNGV